jgi:hypothetical protein
MKASTRTIAICTGAWLFAACGGGASVTRPERDGSVDGGVCGTLDDPGVMTLEGLTPAPGTSVVNRHIVHGFTVRNAPASNVNFTLRYGSSHTAGGSTPDSPRFQATTLGTDVVYQLTIDAWSRAPGHVELIVATSFTTSKGCTWTFPSPLFSYDITPDPTLDGGSPRDAGASVEAGAVIDAPALDQAAAVDAIPVEIDATLDVAQADDGPPPVEIDASVDGESPPSDGGLD